MSELDLNEHHQSLVMNYIKFVKQQRAQNLKAVYYAFQDVIDSRLAEETYTAEEVRELLSGLCAVVRADVESELISHSRATALLLRQLLAQAEKWHLRLTADFSQLHDREQLEQIAGLEDIGAGGGNPVPSRSDRPLPAGGRLAPLGADSDTGSGGAALLAAENRRLETRCGSLEEQLEEARLLAQVRQQQIIRLNEELDAVREKLAVTAASSQAAELHKEHTTSDVRVAELEEKVSQLSVSLSGTETARTELSHQLKDISEELKVTRSRLTLTEKVTRAHLVERRILMLAM